MDIYMAASNTLDKELPSTSLVSGNIVHGFDKNLFSFLYGLEVNIKGAETYPVDAEVYYPEKTPGSAGVTVAV